MPACPKSKPLRDPAYRRRAQRMPCRVTGCPVTGDSGKVVLAHIRRRNNAGTGRKPPDSHSLYLCTDHHMDYDGSPNRCEWLVDMIFLPEQEQAWLTWKSGVGG